MLGYYQPPLQQQQQQTRLDLKAMPSVTQVTEDEIKKIKQSINFTAPAQLPPPVTALESVNPYLIDAGNARSCHMTSTLYQLPSSREKLAASGLDFAIVVNPFSNDERSGMYIPLSQSQIVRCNRCKAYMSPFMEFVDGGRSFRCCMCTHTNEVPQHYFCNLNQYGKRADAMDRPELNLGSYEFRVTSEYYRNAIPATRRPHLVFAIELTINSKPMVENLARYLPDILKEFIPSDFGYQEPLKPLIAFVTYNSKIHLYDVINGGHAYIIADMSAVSNLAPTSKFLVDPITDFEKIQTFVESLPNLCTDLHVETQTIFGPVIEAALKTCSADTSNWFEMQETEPIANGTTKKQPLDRQQVIPTGKVFVFHSSLPTFGTENTPGRLSQKRNIEDLKKYLGTDKEKDILSPEGKYYTELAEKCVRDYASGIELFLFPQDPKAFLNIATLSELACLTGTGVVNKHYSFSNPEYFIQDLKFSLQSTMAFDASMRIRTSPGISPARYIGNFNKTLSSNIEMAAVNTSSNFVTIFKYDENLPDNEMVVVQFAMIYTALGGERRVRVHNLALGTCNLIADLFKTACCDTIMNVLVRDSIDKMRNGSVSPKAAKEKLTSNVINILASYRKHCTENHSSSTSQLVLPEVLKLLPVYLCGALKCDAIDGGPDMFPDDKVLAQIQLLGATLSLSQVTVYPKMYAICPAEDINEYNLEAVTTRCFSIAIEENSGDCYILENGFYLFIFFPSTDEGQKFLSEVYGHRKDDPNLSWETRIVETRQTKFLEETIDQIVKDRRRSLKIQVVRQGRDKLESIFRIFLYEDKKKQESYSRGPDAFKLDNASYVEVLCYLHQEIRTKIQQ